MKLLMSAILLVSTALLSCAHAPVSGAKIGTRLDEDAYSSLINKYTRHNVQYDGFYQRFDVYVTFLNSPVQAAILQKRSDIYEWTDAQAQNERDKMFQSNSTQTKFAVSLFVPDTKINDLNLGTSIWKLYLDTGGKRYEGHAVKRQGTIEDIKSMFPYHSRFDVAYEVSFDVPLSLVEQGPATFTMTSPQGTARLKF